MRTADFESPTMAHLVGIGGAGMSGIATAFKARGHTITGSDLGEGRVVRRLRADGIPVALGHKAENLPADAEVLVVSAAIGETNPELLEARRRKLPVLKYAEALGVLMAGTRGVAVAGAHGKTTTTGVLAFVLDRLGADPTFVVGGEVGPLGGSSRVGKGPFLVAEACEYDRSFLHLKPEVAVVTNIDEDHLDYYSGIAEITEAFREFGRLLPPHGLLVTLNEHREAFERDPGFAARLITVGIRALADWVAADCEVSARSTRFTVRRHGEDVDRVTIRVPGYHNVLNSLMALAVVDHLGFDPGEAARAIAEFQGVRRRFEIKARRAGIVVMDDYAHHPAEIRAALASIRTTWPNSRIWCVFQPHQASRTRFLLREFAAALAGADRVVVPDIFFARDSAEERRLISSRDLVMKVLNLGANAEYIPDFDLIEQHLLENLRPRDVVVTMGAGDIFRVADAVAARLERYGATSIPA
jgi:UDP-N-acetylmuramate--alanine ligase